MSKKQIVGCRFDIYDTMTSSSNQNYENIFLELECLFHQKELAGDECKEIDAIIQTKLKLLKSSYDDLAISIAKDKHNEK